jgi:hypothetical protein
MAFAPGPNLPDFAKLKSAFVGARDQIKNYLLYQTITQLLDANQKMKNIFKGDIEGNTAAIADISDSTFLTSTDESDALTNSRNLLAGIGIAFDDTVDNERTISATSSGVSELGYWTPLIESFNPGDSELVLTDANAPIAVWTPTP